MAMIEKFKPKASKRTLFFIAGAVWAIAGFNILKIAEEEFAVMSSLKEVAIILGLIGFTIFFSKVFNKNSKRIVNMENEEPCLFAFFDKKGYMIMAFMMTMGISLRAFNLISGVPLVVIYIAIGLSLSVSAASFLLAGINYEKTVEKHLVA